MNSPLESFIILDSVDSTNNYAMALIHSGMAKTGMSVMAFEQTAGKGRLNKQWKSDKGSNITISFIEDLSFMAVYNHFYISIAVSLACIDFLNGIKLDGFLIKWPNDIYFNDKKAGGILIENILSGNLIKWSVIGIGLNINQTRFQKGINATSLSAITGSNFNIKDLAIMLKQSVSKRLSMLKNIDPEEILQEYNNFLFGSGRKMRLKKGNVIFETTIKKVNINGELLTEDVMERIFQFDQIEWIIK